ncbi:MAG: potassium transporter [Desulfobacterales bacterium CG07_land_8_20_14_0_80_52_14]|nr:MAG: potassium transporter [Desulfobacterales bacterium CG23_combo_of_CG06-09_8_20_14_all_52_9]PIU49859.1 MAG: potassium transporter [Desulfobacterales bacterium CG07_land_8_20_14_0_80_52_14]
MRWRYIFNVVSVLTFYFGMSMIFPVIVSLIYRDQSLLPLIESMLATLAFGLTLHLINRRFRTEIISQREGMAIVAISWIMVSLFGALPFFLDGILNTFTDAFFESVSGFTTTGASVLTNIEVVSQSLLFWRSFIQWLGGMGIIVLSLAILPFLGVGGMQLYKAEVPTPVPDKLKPRIRDTATLLWKVYALMSLLQVAFLMFGGMSLFDALCHTFTTMPTGGFSTKNASIAHYHSLYLEIVIIVFMVLAGINFSLHYQVLRGRPLAFWRDSECRFFLISTLLFTVLVSLNIYRSPYERIGDAFRYGSFQVVSIVTTTGFATADYEKWPVFSQFVLLILMFLGASAGSTGGGVKSLRVMLFLKYCGRELFYLVHPRAVAHVKIGGKVVPEDVIRSVMGFLGLYAGIFVLSSLLLSALGVDLVTSMGATAATLGNVGPGLGLVGPVDNFANIPYLGKWLLSWCMLLGRLEIYTLIIFFAPAFWRK